MYLRLKSLFTSRVVKVFSKSFLSSSSDSILSSKQCISKVRLITQEFLHRCIVIVSVVWKYPGSIPCSIQRNLPSSNNLSSFENKEPACAFIISSERELCCTGS